VSRLWRRRQLDSDRLPASNSAQASRRSGRPIDIPQLTALLLSHLHADHASGVEDFLYYQYFAVRRRATIATHAHAAERIWPNLLAAGMDQALINRDSPPVSMRPGDFFDSVIVDESRPVQVGPFSIEGRPTLHSIPTYAYRITLNGRTLGFSADTPWDPSLIEWLSPCDLIVHEVTSFDDSPVHTPYRFLANLPEPLREKMRLFHYPDDFDNVGSLIRVLEEGELVRV
jgi:ribonuclease BN (tRNA processing enzyme)